MAKSTSAAVSAELVEASMDGAEICSRITGNMLRSSYDIREQRLAANTRNNQSPQGADSPEVICHPTNSPKLVVNTAEGLLQIKSMRFTRDSRLKSREVKEASYQVKSYDLKHVRDQDEKHEHIGEH